jgi:hypothetical protein
MSPKIIHEKVISCYGEKKRERERRDRERERSCGQMGNVGVIQIKNILDYSTSQFLY